MLKRFVIALCAVLLTLLVIDRASLFFAPCIATESNKSQQYDDGSQQACAKREGIVVAGIETLKSIPPDWWTALAGVAVAFFTFTLWRSTDRLWEAGEKQRIASEKTSRQELRAYLGIDAGSATIVGSEVAFAVNIKNKGKTPAHDVSRAAMADVLAINTQDMPTIDREDGRWMIVPEAFWTPRRRLPLDDVMAAEHDLLETDVFFWGRVEYTDTFGDPHWMTFNYRLGGRVINAKGEHVGWEIEVREQGNDTDRQPN